MEENKKIYDLEERTLIFAINLRKYVRLLPKTIANFEDIKQIVRSSGSVGANYIEANEKLGDKDFLLRIKISRKEAKETAYWLKIILGANDLENNIFEQGNRLLNEIEEIKLILSSIINKYKK